MSQQEKSKKPLSQIQNLTVFHQGGQSQDQSLKCDQSQDRSQSDESQASRVASQAQASQGVAFQYDRQELSSPDSSFSQEMTPELWMKVQDANYRLIDNGLIQLDDDDDINQQETVSETQSQPVYSSRLNRFHTRFRAGPRFQNSQDAKKSNSQ